MLSKCESFTAREATYDELMTVHSRDHVEKVSKALIITTTALTTSYLVMMIDVVALVVNDAC